MISMRIKGLPCPICRAARSRQEFHDRAAREIRLTQQIRHDIRQIPLMGIRFTRSARMERRRLHAALLDGHFRLRLNDLRSSDPQLRRHLCTALFQEFIRREIHMIARLPFDPVPECLEILREKHCFVQGELLPVTCFLNPQAGAGTAADGFDCGAVRHQLLGKVQLLPIQIMAQRFLHIAGGINIRLFTEKGDDLLRLFQPQRFFFALLRPQDERCKIGKLQDTEANAVLLILLLQGGGKLIIALVRDDREDIHAPIVLALALLIDAQPQPASDFLPLLDYARRLVQRADLKDIRIVPALLECRVRKDVPNLAVEGEELFLLLHDEIVCAVIRRRRPRRILPPCRILFRIICRKIAFVHALRFFCLPMKRRAQLLVLRFADQLAIDCLEPDRILPLVCPRVIVHTIVRHLVDEEQTENLDSLRPQQQLLVEMLLDGRAYLLTLDFIRMDLSDGFMQMQHLGA